jgi:hypothetical protein
LFFFEIRLYFQVFFQIRKKDSPNKRNPPIFSGFLPSRKNNHGYGILKSKKKTGREKLPIWNPPIFSGFLPSFFLFPLSFFSFLSLRREMGKTIPEMESAYIFRFSSKSTSQGKSAYIFRFSFPLFVSRSLPFLFSQNNGYHRGESFFASV